MIDPSTDPNNNTQGAGSSDTGGQTQTRTLEQVYEDYESSLTDFDSKLAAFTTAQSALTASAQTVSGFKQELDALEQTVDSSFDKVKPYLPTT